VEAGKKAAGIFLKTLNAVRSALTATPQSADQIASAIQADAEEVYHCLTHLAANGGAKSTLGATPAEDTFCN
jgi:glucose-6-phosphate isomerase